MAWAYFGVLIISLCMWFGWGDYINIAMWLVMFVFGIGVLYIIIPKIYSLLNN